MNPAVTPPHTRIRQLEGLRGLAAVVVMVHHLVITCWLVEFGHVQSAIDHWPLPGPFHPVLVQLAELFADGHLAVWVFWIMSAYVLPIRLFSEEGRFFPLAIRRYVRLGVPVLASILFAWALLKAGWMFAHKLAIVTGSPYSSDWLASFYTFSPNLPFALRTAFWDTFFHFDEPSSYNPVLWTIEKEYWGSLLIYALVCFQGKSRHRLWVYAGALLLFLLLKKFWVAGFVLGLLWSDYDHLPGSHPFWPWLQTWETRLMKVQAIWLILSFVAVLFLRLGLDQLHFPTDLKNMILSILIVYATLRLRAWRYFFNQKWLTWLGKISFSLYLIHLPLLCAFTCWWVLGHPSFAGKMVGSLLSFALALGLSVLFERWIDRPGVRLSRRLFRKNQ